MRYHFEFLWHWLTSNSRHGTHSPFVYKLADEAVYKKSGNGRRYFTRQQQLIRRGEALLSRILNYFQKREIQFWEENPDFISGDVLIVGNRDFSEENLENLLTVDRMIVIPDIYSTKYRKSFWNQMIQHPKVTVGIDLFHFGILIHREGQIKENFKLRFPSY